MEPLLAIAEDLERRDARVAAALRDVEQLQRELGELRIQAAATAGFLAELPGTVAAQRAEEHAAAAARVAAEEELHAAEAELARREERGSESAKLEAARAVRQARDALDAAELRVERARAEGARLERDAAERRAEAERLEQRAAALAGRLGPDHEVAPPGPGLDGALDWAARARGELLVAQAGLASERDKVVREASELLASALGEPLATTSVAGLRDRLASVLRD